MAGHEQPTGFSGLHWGVKQSFCGYVSAMGGAIEAGAGAERGPDGGFQFAAAPGGDLAVAADGSLTGRGGFVGEVRFEAHGGMLSVFLADPAIEVGEAGATLSVADSAGRARRVTVAKLNLAAMTIEPSGERTIPAALTLDGSQLLGDHYPPGTVIDPVILTPAGG